MYPTIIMKSTMYKKSQQKRRTSPCNYKERFFVLNTQELTYSEPRPGKKPTLKGCIELSRIKCVEIVRTNAPIPCKYKYPFLVVHDSYFLYIFAPDNDCRLRWVRALKEETKHNNLSPTYHPDVWMDGRWRCCHVTEKCANGCHPCGSVKPLPPTPDLQRRFSDPKQRLVVAMKDFVPAQDLDLPLHKDEEFILIDSSQPNWWTVQDRDGNVGLVPCTYVAERSCDNFTRFAWYNKDITRTEAEELLLKEGKEGSFMVRDSRQRGVYTVSVFTKAPGSNGEKNPRVKHYQIRQSEEEGKFYLAEKYLFSTIPELIHYHQHNAAGLITRLRHCVSWGRQVSEEPSEEPSLETLELDPEDLELVLEVGSGQFGLVWQGEWRDLKVAVKMVREGAMSEEEFKEEAQVMKKLSHPKLVQLLGVCLHRSPSFLVFEFMEGGCLNNYLRCHRGALSQDTLLGMCLDVSEGMAYLESSNFIHRDLAARNCLVSEDLSVKVSDFGMTRFVLDDQYTSSQGTKFPMKWSAPEVIKYCRFSSKSDVWAFGILMWEVYTEGRLPYENRTNTEVLEDLNAGMRLLKPRLAPQSLYELMQWCWKEKPGDRPSFTVLLHELASVLEL
ncbi:tyrosine-protein kinase ITK/TSK isoform X2 [Clupea harengus]|uniref:Tyrosine-protein kinase n=1 Tax=Clupea harengus TaxID=7950 RepID=A0A6P3W1W9_CLUHA|nr:tyrosine-protein kinase ITK/TSK isoform X2 [Clupea harengus]